MAMEAEVWRRWRRANNAMRIGLLGPPMIFIPLDLINGAHKYALIHLNLAAFFGATILLVTLRMRDRCKRRLSDECKIVAGLVLHEADNEEGWQYGYDLSKAIQMRSGRMYPALDRLMRDGLVEDSLDEEEPDPVHRRRLYRLRRG